MQEVDISDLLRKFKEGSITQDELALLENWYLQWTPQNFDISLDDIELVKNNVWNAVREHTEKPKAIRWLWPFAAAAASILLFLSLGSHFLFHPKLKVTQQIAQVHDIAPGGNKAILTLANGKQIVLTGAQKGVLAKQGAIVINKTRDGQIVYTAAATAAQNSKLVNYNSIETPRGGQYHLTLADGTNVWLNAASSIKYPVAFTGNERRVEITGEAYFEVKHNAAKPFRVICNGQTVEDLGTSFNVNAYSDENAIKTTLLEGSVKVSSAGENKMLIPGEQALLEKGNIRIANVDVNRVVAWKNGMFEFKDADIGTVMRQLSRWYDVDVKYQGKIPDALFSGKLHMNVNASQILDILSFFKVHFKIENEGAKKMIIVIS
jgi:hypothetical protein